MLFAMYKSNYSKIMEVLESRSFAGRFDYSNPCVSEKDFDQSVWECSRNLLMHNEELVCLFGQKWILEKLDSQEVEVSQFHSALHCLDWLFTELTVLKSAPVPGFFELNAMVLGRGPNSMRARIVCHKRGGPFLEGVAKGVLKAFGEDLEVFMETLNPSCCDLRLGSSAR